MKTMILAALALSSLPAMAARGGDLFCRFDHDAYTVTASLDARGALRVEAFTNLSGDDLNAQDGFVTLEQNPIAPARAKDGRVKYTMEAISSGGDYGDICRLYLPAKITKGAMPASYACTMLSHGAADKVYVQGGCTLQ
jgi:hypothetical protein